MSKESFSAGEFGQRDGVRFVRLGVNKNLGNYQSMRAEVEIALQEGETAREAFGRCREILLQELGK